MMTRSAILKAAVLLTGVLLLGALAIGGAESTLLFNHTFHADDVGMACEDCHDDVTDLAYGDPAMRPDHDTCSMCHEDAIDEDCEYCHAGGEIPDEIVLANDDANRYLGFAHNTHGDVECLDCHMLGEMDVMMPATVDCQSCHEMHEVMPSTHNQSSYLSDHGYDAYAAGGDCAACHEQTSCDECHQGENVLAGTPHPPEWTFTHHLETMYGRECLACHETRNECVTCHRATVPTPHELGPAFANNNGGGSHATDAKGFILQCLVCHDVENSDPVCARCHQ